MMEVIRYAAFNALPWKNGGGVTHEGMRVPLLGEPFRWRLSVAHIGVGGPFSNFSGYHRIMVLLRGNGLRLKFAGLGEATLHDVGDMVEFDGSTSTDCDLLDGPCSDLNLMVSTSLVGTQARVERLSRRLRLPPSLGSTLLFGVRGSWSVACIGEQVAHLEPWDLALLTPAEHAILHPVLPDEAAPPLVFLATVHDNCL